MTSARARIAGGMSTVPGNVSLECGYGGGEIAAEFRR
jgi:hypothetical protein